MLVSGCIRHVLNEDVRRIHRQGNSVLIVKLGRSFSIEDFPGRKPDDIVRAFFMRILRETLVTRQIDPCLGVLGEVHTGHVVKERGNRLFQLRNLLRLFQKLLLLIGGALRLQFLQQQENDDRENHDQRNHRAEPVILQKL